MPAKEQKRTITDFLLAEYNNIAQAHFNMTNTIAVFFKHYLAIVSIPVGVVIVSISLIGKANDGGFRICLGFLPSAALMLLGAVGLLVMLYITNLRIDALLYARSVNGIRSYFLGRSDLSLKEVVHSRVLPSQIHIPRFLEKTYFGFVVAAFALIDSFYASLGLASTNLCFFNMYSIGNQLNSRLAPAAASFLVFFAIHLIAYGWLAWYRERCYLRSNAIGVDIDGVLNKHRDHFARLLNAVTPHNLQPSDITHIPVHEDPAKTITQHDCNLVFNNLTYWTDMPPIEFAPQVLKRLRGSFGLRVYVFTHRDWPQAKDKSSRQTLEKNWRKQLTKQPPGNHPIGRAFRKVCSLLIYRKPIDGVTREWLRRHELPFDRLLVEKGNEHAKNLPSKSENRFYFSRTKNIRYFVEDDLMKAQKLSFTCEVVFLINQPYNQCPPDQLPKNIVRVADWQNLYEHLKSLS